MECKNCHATIRGDSRYCSHCGMPLNVEETVSTALTQTPATPPPAFSEGKLVAGKFRIVDEIGRGGMGVVYKAEDLKLKRPVALKFLPPHLMDEPGLKERFLVEAQAAAALSHPNICTIYEVGEDEGRPYIAMEYVEGETLRQRVRKEPLEPGEAVDIVGQVAAGLAEAHRKGIIHRDVKSANIMVTPERRAKVMDFGLAKLLGGSTLTKSGTTMGTVAYMSPEQARGEELDHRTDIWSLGVVLYEVIAGKLPFRGEHHQAVIHSILHREPEPLARVRPSLAAGLDHVVGQAMAKRPADRYQTMEELREDLAAVADGLRPLKAKPRQAAIRLAVLPLANLTGDPEQEYFSDGLTQEMITLLGRLHPQSLGVIARTSVMRYKKTDTPVDQIGRELGVDYVLEGSARREGSRVRVSAELIQVRDQTQLWADVFEREMAGIPSLQNDVAREVAKALSLKLLPSEQAALAQARPVNPEAHEAYLRGSFHWMKFTPEDLDIAEKYFDLALEKDPSYAPVYAGRACVWVARNQFGFVSPEEAVPKAKAAALKAIELDENLAAAHGILASIRAWMDWEWQGAGESFRRAIELNPNVAGVHAIFSHFPMIMGQSEEALEHSKRAVVLDPFNPLIRSFHAMVLYFQRRYDEAIAAAREALRFQPDHPLANSALWYVLHMQGMEKETIKAAMGVFKVTYNDPRIETASEEGYTQGGYIEAMKRAAEALVRRLPEAFSLPLDIAACYAMASEKDKAIEWVEKGFEARDPNMPYIGIMPCFDGIRPDPRFQELLRKMHLPAYG